MAFKKEEIIIIEPKEIFTAYIFKKPDGEISVAIVYKCELKDSIESINPQEEEIDEWKLFSKEELQNLQGIYPNSIEAINKFLIQ